MHRFASFVYAALALVAAAPLALVQAVERGVAFVWAWLVPEPDRPRDTFDLAGRDVAYAGDVPVDAALLNSLRHEAGMRPLRC